MHPERPSLWDNFLFYWVRPSPMHALVAFGFLALGVLGLATGQTSLFFGVACILIGANILRGNHYKARAEQVEEDIVHWRRTLSRHLNPPKE